MAWCAASGLMASEYHGAVKAGGLPYPGVVVTAIQDGQRMVTTTDDQGTFHFSDLPDGTWTIEIRTLGFEPLVREVGVSAGAPAPEWELKFLPESALAANLGTPLVRENAPAAPARSGQAGGFQRVDVSQQADTGVLAVLTRGAGGSVVVTASANLTDGTSYVFNPTGSRQRAALLRIHHQ